MCVLALAWRAHPKWRLVLAGNRDEQHARPTADLGRWPDAPHVLGGIDLLSGGGWLGVSEQGRFAVVTNVRGYGPPAADAPSRGYLVRDYLTGEGRYADPPSAPLEAFNPMNLIVAEGDEAVFWSNRPTARRLSLKPGIVGMSNGGLDDGWPKTDRLKAFLAAWLDAGEESPDMLLAALADEHRPRDDQLPSTGLDRERERTASAIFIRNPLYGTRCSSVVLIAHDGQGLFVERRFDESGAQTGDSRYPFRFAIL